MITCFPSIRAILAALLLATVVMVGAPVSAQQPTSVNPTASSVKEEQLLQQLQRVDGRITIPDSKASVLIQPAGREWRAFHENALYWIGAIAILGMVVLLAVFLLWRGRIRTESGYSGVTILRFGAFERFMHWLTAACFIVLALTGLNITFGKHLLLPLVGPEGFTTFSEWGKYAHNYLAWPFMLGILLMLVVWIKDNIPGRIDWNWLKRGGGFLDGSHPPAERFNAGQKLIFWSVVIGGIAISVSGLLMLFPFFNTTIAGMQLATLVHALAGVVMIAIILAHIYIGTIGMEGAFSAMGSGEVDLNWAKEHHALWVEEERAKGRAPAAAGRTAPAPAE